MLPSLPNCGQSTGASKSRLFLFQCLFHKYSAFFPIKIDFRVSGVSFITNQNQMFI